MFNFKSLYRKQVPDDDEEENYSLPETLADSPSEEEDDSDLEQDDEEEEEASPSEEDTWKGVPALDTPETSDIPIEEEGGFVTPQERLMGILTSGMTRPNKALEAYKGHIENFPQREEPSNFRRILAAIGAGATTYNEGSERGRAAGEAIRYPSYNRMVQDWLGKGKALGTSANIEEMGMRNELRDRMGRANLEVRMQGEDSRQIDRTLERERKEGERGIRHEEEVEKEKGRNVRAGERNKVLADREKRLQEGKEIESVTPQSQLAARRLAEKAVMDKFPNFDKLLNENGTLKPRGEEGTQEAADFDNFKRLVTAEVEKILGRTRTKAK